MKNVEVSQMQEYQLNALKNLLINYNYFIINNLKIQQNEKFSKKHCTLSFR